ncbi:MAG TPA: hypothetical protein VL944_01035 [Candidatus Acidoferrum sp.]|nr:hypothetical protein [Candidatus Acidoferrum sp.]
MLEEPKIIGFNTLDYPKIPFNPSRKLRVTLLQIFIVNKKDLSRTFLNYDSTYYDEKSRNKTQKHYPLFNGKLIVFLLMAKPNSGKGKPRIFTTIRKWTAQKEKYYRKHSGKTLYIEKDKE